MSVEYLSTERGVYRVAAIQKKIPDETRSYAKHCSIAFALSLQPHRPREHPQHIYQARIPSGLFAIENPPRNNSGMTFPLMIVSRTIAPT